MKEQKLYEFLTELEKLKSTLRHVWTRTGRHESSAEHSWRMAVFFMLVYDMFDFKDIDFKKLMKMILLHDAPELGYGDIPGFIKNSDPARHKAHKDREALFAKKLFAMLPKDIAKEYTALFDEFEEGKSKEAKLGKAIDRIETMLQHLESDISTWTEEEKEDHMLHYPEKEVQALNNSHVSKIWDMIYKKLKEKLR